MKAMRPGNRPEFLSRFRRVSSQPLMAATVILALLSNAQAQRTERRIPDSIDAATNQFLSAAPDIRWSQLLAEGRRAFARGEYGQAEKQLKQALVLAEQFDPPDDRLIVCLNNLAMVQRRLQNRAEASRLLKRSIEVSRSTLGEGHPRVLIGMNNLAGLYRAERRFDEAKELLFKAQALAKLQQPESKPVQALILNNLASLYVDRGRLADAEASMRESVRLLEESLGPTHPQLASGLARLGLLREQQGQPAEAWALLNRAFSIFEKQLGAEHALTKEYGRMLKQVDADSKTLKAASVVSSTVVGPDEPQVVADFAVGRQGRLLLLPVKLGESEYQFILDTGAEVSVFDRALMDKLESLQESARALTADGDREIGLFAAPPFSIGSLSFKGLEPVACTDLSTLRRVTGQPISGILGMDVLQNYVVHINFDLGKVEFLAHADTTADVTARIAFQHRRLPAIDVTLPDGSVVPFVVDSGLGSTGMLRADEFDRLQQAGFVSDGSEGLRATLTGTTRHRDGRLSTVGLSGVQHESLKFERANYNMLGLGWLSRYTVTFDFPGRTIYLNKGLLFDAPDRRDLSGMHIVDEGGKLIVEQIETDSPAERAGLQSNDVLETVGGFVARPRHLFSIRRSLATPKDEVLAVFRRGGRIRTAMLSLVQD